MSAATATALIGLGFGAPSRVSDRKIGTSVPAVTHPELEVEVPAGTQADLIQPRPEDRKTEALGLGPLQPLIEDPSVSDILVNGTQSIYVERNGRLELTDAGFRSDAELLATIQRIVSLDAGSTRCPRWSTPVCRTAHA